MKTLSKQERVLSNFCIICNLKALGGSNQIYVKKIERLIPIELFG